MTKKPWRSTRGRQQLVDVVAVLVAVLQEQVLDLVGEVARLLPCLVADDRQQDQQGGQPLLAINEDELGQYLISAPTST